MGNLLFAIRKFLSSPFRIFHYNLGGVFLLSGLVSILIGASFYFGITGFNDTVADWLVKLYPFDWGKAAISTSALYIATAILTALGMLLYKYVLIVCLAPLMSYTSEKIEQKILGTKGTIKISFIGSVLRGLKITVRNLSKELIYTLLLLLIGLVPMFTPFTSFMILVVQSFYLGAAALDYYAERHYSVKETMAIAKDFQFSITVIGAGFFALLLIPYLGFFIAPFMATIAATEFAIYRIEELA